MSQFFFENFEEKSQGLAISGLWKKKRFHPDKMAPKLGLEIAGIVLGEAQILKICKNKISKIFERSFLIEVSQFLPKTSPNGLITLAEFIYPEISQDRFLGK